MQRDSISFSRFWNFDWMHSFIFWVVRPMSSFPLLTVAELTSKVSFSCDKSSRNLSLRAASSFRASSAELLFETILLVVLKLFDPETPRFCGDSFEDFNKQSKSFFEWNFVVQVYCNVDFQARENECLSSPIVPVLLIHCLIGIFQNQSYYHPFFSVGLVSSLIRNPSAIEDFESIKFNDFYCLCAILQNCIKRSNCRYQRKATC